jgi:hypothetical protein
LYHSGTAQSTTAITKLRFFASVWLKIHLIALAKHHWADLDAKRLLAGDVGLKLVD